MKMRFYFHDGGKSKSKRPKQINDCTVRAIALTFEVSYDIAYNFLKENGRKCSKGFRFGDFMKKNIHDHDEKRGRLQININKEFQEISFKPLKGEKRIKVNEFIEKYNKGTYIVKIAKHVFTLKEGVIYDTFSDYLNKSVYTVYKIK